MCWEEAEGVLWGVWVDMVAISTNIIALLQVVVVDSLLFIVGKFSMIVGLHVARLHVDVGPSEVATKGKLPVLYTNFLLRKQRKSLNALVEPGKCFQQ